MARPPEEVEAILLRTLEEARKHFPVDAAYLFGSYAQGKPDEWSDIDVAIFSSAAGQLSLKERVNRMAKIRIAVGAEIELHVYSDACLARARPNNIYGHILETGRKIA